MFRGSVTILRQNPMMMRVFGAGMVLMIPLVVAFTQVPKIAGLLVPLYVGGYVFFLSRALKPLRDVVMLHVDERGLFADDAPLAMRADILQAYLRPPVPAMEVKGVSLAAFPLTVELVTKQGQLNVDPGGEAQAQQILVSLGAPVTYVRYDHIAQTPQNARNKRRAWLVVVILVVGAIGSYLFFMLNSR